jgi:hypothetical protein
MRISPDGRNVIWHSGKGPGAANPHTVRVNDQILGPGHANGWYNNEAVVFCPQDDTWVQFASKENDWRAGDTFLNTGNSLTAASGRFAVHRTNPYRVITSWRTSIDGASNPALSDNGRWLAYIRPDQPYEGVSSMVCEDKTYWVGAVSNPRFGGTTLTWETGNGTMMGVPDVENPANVAVDLTPEGQKCYQPVPTWNAARGEIFVLYTSDDGVNGHIFLAEWGSLTRGKPRGYKVGVSTGSGYEHDCRSFGSNVLVAYLDPQGNLVHKTIDVTGEREALVIANPIPEDIPWTHNPNQAVVDMLDYLTPAATARIDYPDGTGELWLHKSPERPNWGENWDYDKNYIGFLEDRSTGTRMVSMARPKTHSHTNTTRNRLSPEEIVQRNNNGENLGDYQILPLAGYTWRGNRLWMPRHFTGKFSRTFRTDYVWWDEPQYGGVWEIWKDLQLTIEAEAGYGRFNGHEVFVRTRYGKPHGDEWNYWGPHGWVAFIATDPDGTVNAKSIAPPDSKGAAKGPFVPARFPRVYPILRETPVEPPEENMIPIEEAKNRAAFPAPNDIIDGAISAFRENLLDRDKLPGDNMTAGAWRYFGQYYYSKLAELQIASGVPGTAEGWGHYSLLGVERAKAKYNADQKGTDGDGVPENPEFAGPLRVEGAKVYNSQGEVPLVFCGFLYGLSSLLSDQSLKDGLLQRAKLGFNGIRVFAGELTGRGQTAESARGRLPYLLGEALKLGLYVQVCAITDSAVGYDVHHHLREVARICAQFPNTILEIANEIGHPTQASLDIPALRATARSVFGGIIIDGADVSTDELLDNEYKYSGGDAISSHLRRNHSPGGVPMPWYHEACRLTELGKIRDRYNKPVISGEPNRVENKDNPVGFAYLLGAISAGLGLGSVFHSSQARDAQELTGTQLEAAMAFVAGSRDFAAGGQFVNGHWAESPVKGVKWYDPPLGAKAWRIYTFIRGNTAQMLITGSPDPNNWRQAFDDFQHGWFPTSSVIRYGNPTVVLSR